ncbi:MAG: hypothetical protein ABIQ01_09790 [Pseudolysinimonas sp.]
MPRPQRALALPAAILLLAVLAGCIPGGGGGSTGGGETIDLATEFPRLGIAIVAFETGEVGEVEGDAVLSVTDWQVEQMQLGLPELDENGQGPAQGIESETLDGAAAALGEPGATGLAPSLMVKAWWHYGESPRADLARRIQAAPPLSTGAPIPLAVSTLFMADAMEDLGRTDAGVAQEGLVPVGGGTALRDPLSGAGPCGVINGVVEDMQAYLDGAGVVGSVITFAVEKAFGKVADLAGPGYQALRTALTVMNVASNIGSLVQNWQITWSFTNAPPLMVGDGQQGDATTLTAKVEGPTAKVPAGVAACLATLGVADPTSQKDSPVVDFLFPAYITTIEPATLQLISPDQGKIDENNEVFWTIAAGAQTMKAKDTEILYNTAGFQQVFIRRADTIRLAKAIIQLNTPSVQKYLGDGLAAIAENLVMLAMLQDVYYLPVGYRWPKEEPKPSDEPVIAAEFDQLAGPAKNHSLPPVQGCVAPWKVEWVTGEQVVQHRWYGSGNSFVPGSFESEAPVPGQIPKLDAGTLPPGANGFCYYGFADGRYIVNIPKFPVPPEDLVSGVWSSFMPSNCEATAGYLPSDDPNSVALFLFDGANLSVYGWGKQGTDPKMALVLIAGGNGECNTFTGGPVKFNAPEEYSALSGFN